MILLSQLVTVNIVFHAASTERFRVVGRCGAVERCVIASHNVLPLRRLCLPIALPAVPGTGPKLLLIRGEFVALVYETTTIRHDAQVWPCERALRAFVLWHDGAGPGPFPRGYFLPALADLPSFACRCFEF